MTHGRQIARLLIGLSMVGALAAGGHFLLDRGSYGFSLFVLIPLLIGALPTWAFGAPSGRAAAGWGLLAAVISQIWLLALAWEGIVCVLMAAPMVAPLGALGGYLAYQFGRLVASRLSAGMFVLLPLVTLHWDASLVPEQYAVTTAIEVSASPETVWKHVISFPDLPEPTDWVFRSGIAYPQRARIDGTGPGAIRYCEFSTGAFVEPIEVWEAPRLLRFGVTENPPPMQERSFYGEISPRHLDGYLISRRGQFRLTALANGRTRLEGTTWYQHGLWPATYWRWWSDAIIHRIHLRVLQHVRRLAEAGG